MSEKSSAPVEVWDPFRALDLLHEWPLSRMFGGSREGSLVERWSPSLDLAEDDNHFVVTVELAGAKKEDVHVEVEDGVLTIRGEKKSEREEKNEKRRYTERSFGAFSRSFTLPSNADAEDVKANFENGVLKIEIGKREKGKARTVKVR
jgi:HSP20 family protein